MDTKTTKKPAGKQPAVRKTPAEKLKAELASAKSRIATLEARNRDLEAQIAGYRKSSTGHDRELATMESKLRIARDALAPFRTKTKDWTWPPLQVEAIRPVTWGDLKAVATAAAEFAQ